VASAFAPAPSRCRTPCGTADRRERATVVEVAADGDPGAVHGDQPSREVARVSRGRVLAKIPSTSQYEAERKAIRSRSPLEDQAGRDGLDPAPGQPGADLAPQDGRTS
jgi:hypothetical protein